MRKIVLFLSVFFVSILSAKGDLYLLDVENKSAKITPNSIEKVFVDDGFGVVVNSDMIKPFMIQFQKTDYEVFTLMTIYHKDLSIKLVQKYPQAGALTPLGVGIYQAKDDDRLHVSFLTASGYKKVLGVDDKLIDELNTKVLDSLKKALPNAKLEISKEAIKTDKELITRYEVPIDEDGEEIEDVLFSLSNGLSMYGFVTPGTVDLAELMDDSIYDFYQGYSICKLPVIYTVSQTKPEASAFAPCTLAMYKKKGDDKLVMEFPAVYNWISSADIKDEPSLEQLLKAQEQFEAILEELME
ncbi:MAG: DUF302 domain-containing protein [Sulfurimonas sp.]|jgi:uncharacterized protein (DUF302 family)|nr:DUF302 domain-containing protein [Sulfurimonadaceae bacterium]